MASVPASMSSSEAIDILEQLIGEGMSAAQDIVNTTGIEKDSDSLNSAEIALRCDYCVCDGKTLELEGTDIDCTVDVDTAYYIGDGDDGVYFNTFKDEANNTYWMSAIADCDTGCFCDSLVTAQGPYDSISDAIRAGIDTAAEWCILNDVDTISQIENMYRMVTNA